MSGVNNSIYIQISALVYCILLIIIYFGRKQYKSFENRIYSSLIIVNFVGLIIDITLGFVSAKYLQYQVLTTILTKLYLLYFVTWIGCFTYYIITISSKDKSYKKLEKDKIYLVLFVLTLIIIYVLPVKFSQSEKGIHSYGYGTTLAYIVSTIAIIICVSTFVKNYKIKKSKKYLPVLIFMFMGTIVALIQFTNPTLILIPAMETFITFLMYFTIENPDVKLMEQYYKSKEIMDNANEDKILFLYDVTNELKGINRNISKSSLNIEQEINDKKINKEVVIDNLREINQCTARFNTIINESFNISEIDSATLKVYNEKYNIKLLLRKIITTYNDKCNQKDISFRSKIVSDLPDYLYGDSLGLKNVLTIILDNSLKYTKSGYIDLNVNLIAKKDIIRLIISIEDSGVGILPGEISNIFNKDNTKTKNDVEKNLYEVKKIITSMGGVIIASSNYNDGTKFKIFLDQKKVEMENSLVDYDKVYDKKKILLIEDSETTYKLITKMLKNTNIIIDRVVLGSEGLDKIRNKEKYDLILVEEELKPLNGYDIIKKLKLIKNFNAKVVLLTKNPNIEYSYLYKDEGFSDYLIKPINRSLLLNIINKYL